MFFETQLYAARAMLTTRVFNVLFPSINFTVIAVNASSEFNDKLILFRLKHQFRCLITFISLSFRREIYETFVVVVNMAKERGDHGSVKLAGIASVKIDESDFIADKLLRNKLINFL